MKNRLTKVICVLLSLVMLFGLSSITTSAAAEESAVSSTIPDGPNANGCFYLNGEKQHAYKLIAFDGAVLKDNVITELGKDKLLNTYGIKTEMDLRDESVSLGDMLGEGVAHKYYNAPQYEQIFTVGGKAKMKEIFTDLADPGNYPIYLHCSYGVDRTGTTCYLLEAVLGLDETQLQSEFALSGWKYSYKQEYADKIKNGLNDYEGDTIRQRAVSYLLSCGITQQQIDTLRDIYLED